MQKLYSIQYLRGLAALGVLLFHASAFVGGYGSHAISPNLGHIGEAGVDVFFVISGFILTLVTRASRGPSEFMAGRLARVGVPYWGIILALALMTLIAPSAFRSFAWHARDLVLSLAFIPSILRDGSIFPLLEPGWTLSLEMLFYTLLALTLTLRLSHATRSALVAAMLCALVVLGLVLHLPQGESDGWFFTQAILVEFCFGIGLAELYLAGRQPGRMLAAAMVVLGLGGLALAAFDPPFAFSPERALIYGIPAALIVGGAVFLEAAGLSLRSAVLNFLGNVSYSLYLTHVLVLAVAAKLLAGRLPGLAGDLAMLAAACAAAIAAAYVYYRLVERPALRLAHLLQNRIGRARPARSVLPRAA